MQRVFLLSTLITLLSTVVCYSQTTNDTLYPTSIKPGFSTEELKGLVLDIDNHTPLPYANIYVLHKNIGAISNEKGYFSINISDLDITDTVRFQYIGYKTKNITIGQVENSTVVYLKEDIINLSKILVFGSAPDPESIVKKVLKNKDSNYRSTTTKNQTFIRERYISDIDEISFDLKKSSFSQLDEKITKLAEEKIPKHSTSYTDFLGDLYFTKNKDDSILLKIDPIRTVSLKEKNIAELEQLETIFEDIFAETKEEEYWKIKSGIISQKIDIDDGNDEAAKDTLNENNRRLHYFRRRVENQLNYRLLDDKKDWEFLHSTGKYNYTLAGGTSVNGEDVYIIDFEPKNSGNYIGRMFIAINTFALVRADYQYARGKTGKDIHLFGIGYTENQYSGSIYFEKKGDNYCLKYFSQKIGSYVIFDRSVALLKKSKRFLFDKKLNEIKVGIKLAVNSEESVEYLVLDDIEITDKQFADFEQKEHMEIIYVDQFDDQLWQGFSIIEPTEQMREYKKQELK